MLYVQTVLFMGRHSNTTEPLPYLSASSFGACLHSVGSLNLQAIYTHFSFGLYLQLSVALITWLSSQPKKESVWT